MVVVGAGGRLGRHLVPALRSHGHSVLPITRAQADAQDEDEMRRAVRRGRIDVIVGLAAYTSVTKAETERQKAITTNTEIGRTLGVVAGRTPALLVSTDYVFNGQDGRAPYGASDRCNPTTAYGASKLAGEQAFFESGRKGRCVARMAFVDPVDVKHYPILNDHTRSSREWVEKAAERLATWIGGDPSSWAGVVHLVSPAPPVTVAEMAVRRWGGRHIGEKCSNPWLLARVMGYAPLMDTSLADAPRVLPEDPR